MKITTFTLPNLMPYRQKVILFLRKNGEGRITHRALRWLSNISTSEHTPGSIALVALEEKQLAGVMIFSRYGIEEAITAVHPRYRKQGVGEALLMEAKEKLGKVYTRVACDNIPSLKLCFRCGFTAFQLFKGPTGKPTLWLGGGEYDPKDIL
ncbi:GNAT family N-acetyltransferase [Shimazuella alba]|jgi:GNAT superfamily N-acetyltransferase|uniref:GNAT family N-acetyltransferase n=1 Tax=Shimazuella alba TaxID=2690964 RepID=A0A6I4VUD3_9BACL|nr:GNAT family N-acetyltransferase [Shimazuella alba]MXQ54138.1 GNAT family N-acetyltransferase [Shimazuella alba]